MTTAIVEPTFTFRGARYVAWVAREIEDGCRDVVVYRIDHGELPTWIGCGVYGKRFVPIDFAPRWLCYAIDDAVRAAVEGR